MTAAAVQKRHGSTADVRSRQAWRSSRPGKSRLPESVTDKPRTSSPQRRKIFAWIDSQGQICMIPCGFWIRGRNLQPSSSTFTISLSSDGGGADDWGHSLSALSGGEGLAHRAI